MNLSPQDRYTLGEIAKAPKGKWVHPWDCYTKLRDAGLITLERYGTNTGFAEITDAGRKAVENA